MTEMTDSIRAALLAAAFAAAPAAAQGTPPGKWQFEATPYLWASAMKGDVQAGVLPRTSVDVGFSDLAENLDFGFMGTIEGRRDRWGFLLDAIYVKVSASAVATRTGPGPIGATLTAHADARIEQGMYSGAVAYRAVDGPTNVDVLAGARYNRVDARATIAASLFGLAGFSAHEGEKKWWDPYVGARVQHRLNERWTLIGYGDVGGFGAGSDLAWQALAGLNFAVSGTMTVKVGYRYLSVDYDRHGFLYDIKTHGPIFGAGMRF